MLPPWLPIARGKQTWQQACQAPGPHLLPQRLVLGVLLPRVPVCAKWHRTRTWALEGATMHQGGVVPRACTQAVLSAGGTDGAAQLDQAWLNCGTAAPVTRGTAPRRAHPPPQTPRTHPPPQSAAAAPPAWRPPGAWPSLLLRSCTSAGLQHGVRRDGRRDGRRRRGAGLQADGAGGCLCVRGARLRGLEVAGASSEPGAAGSLGWTRRGGWWIADRCGERRSPRSLAAWEEPEKGSPHFQPAWPRPQRPGRRSAAPTATSAAIPLQLAAGRSAPRLQTCPPFVARPCSARDMRKEQGAWKR